MSTMSWKERLSAVPFQRKLLVILNAGMLIACLSFGAALHSVGTAFETTTAAARFGGESGQRFAHLACYLPVGGGKSEEDILSLRSALESRLTEQSLAAPEGGSLYIDAYSTSAKITAVTDHAAAEVSAFGVGGNFFHFHPLRLRSGAYITERDLMDDLVVLDEAMAWRLFGGTELSGLTIYIEGEPFVVAGVVAMEDDFAAERAMENEGTLFLSYSALKRLKDDISISCYEIVLPDPITGYARSTVESLLAAEDSVLVEVSSRFSPANLFGIIKSFGERSMRTKAVVFPYWENALRLAEDHGALLLLLTALTALCPLMTAIVLMARGVRALWRFTRREIPARISAAVERHKENRLARITAEAGKGE